MGRRFTLVVAAAVVLPLAFWAGWGGLGGLGPLPGSGKGPTSGAGRGAERGVAPGGAGALGWDLSGGRAVSVVGWPEGEAGEFWSPPAPGVVRVRLPGGRQADLSYMDAHLGREGGRVRTMFFWLEAGTLDEAHARAAALMGRWQIDGRASLDAWRRRTLERGIDHANPDLRDWHAETAAGAYPRYGVALRCTPGWKDDPWVLGWGVVFAPPAPFVPPASSADAAR